VILWALAGLCLLGLLAVSVMTAGVWAIAKPEWQAHQPAGGGFRIELPGSPKDMTQLYRSKPEPGVRVFGTILHFHREEYGVIWVEINVWDLGRMTDEALLDRAVSG